MTAKLITIERNGYAIDTNQSEWAGERSDSEPMTKNKNMTEKQPFSNQNMGLRECKGNGNESVIWIRSVQYQLC